jgi:hypothetical protein
LNPFLGNYVPAATLGSRGEEVQVSDVFRHAEAAPADRTGDEPVRTIKTREVSDE